jgi:P27 family predicted phage terminase small subunit
MRRDVPKPPKHLRKQTRDWFASLVESYDFESHHLRLLQNACECWDRAQDARESLAEHGLTYTNARGEPKARPETSIARDAMALFARLMRELGLDVADGPAEAREPQRPPRLAGTAGRRRIS